MNVLDLFSGIGGFSLGLERAGMRTVAFCEIEPYCRKVLAQHWSGVPIYEDVRTLTGARLAADGIAADLICGGFPCQDISVAGKGAGIAEGTRSGLWSSYARIIGDVLPKYVVVENVANLLSGPAERPGGWFGRVLGDLAALGYHAEWHCIPAAAIGAPHERDRVWIVAYDAFRRRRDRTTEIAGEGRADGTQIPPGGLRGDVSHTDGSGCVEQRRTSSIPAQLFAAECGDWWRVEPDVGRVADGIPFRVDRLAALGNALVPQIPELIGRAIMAHEAATEHQENPIAHPFEDTNEDETDMLCGPDGAARDRSGEQMFKVPPTFTESKRDVARDFFERGRICGREAGRNGEYNRMKTWLTSDWGKPRPKLEPVVVLGTMTEASIRASSALPEAEQRIAYEYHVKGFRQGALEGRRGFHEELDRAIAPRVNIG